MLRTLNAQPTLWESILPEMCLGMPAELESGGPPARRPGVLRAVRRPLPRRARAPVGAHRDLPAPDVLEVSLPAWVRADVPGGRRLDQLAALLSDPARGRRAAPDDADEDHDAVRDERRSTASTRRCWPRQLAAKVLKTNRLRADTTVVPANVAYPTDSGLLAKGVAKMAKAIKALKAKGLAPEDQVAGPHADGALPSALHRGQPSSPHRRGQRRSQGHQCRAGPPSPSTAVERGPPGDDQCPAHTSRSSATPHRDRLTALADDLEITAVEGRADRRPDRNNASTATPPMERPGLVSLHDPDARPIRKGRLGKPVEFGYKAQVVDNEDGIVVDHNVEMGNPPDAPMLAPAIERVAARARTMPTAVTADRGYGETSVEDALSALGVATVVLPTKGKPNASRRAIEQRPAFQRLVKWRTGSEGRISCLKRDFGWNRTQIDGLEGARIWCGHGVFNHNLVKIAALTTSE